MPLLCLDALISLMGALNILFCFPFLSYLLDNSIIHPLDGFVKRFFIFYCGNCPIVCNYCRVSRETLDLNKVVR